MRDACEKHQKPGAYGPHCEDCQAILKEKYGDLSRPLQVLEKIMSGELTIEGDPYDDPAWITRRYDVSNGWKFWVFFDGVDIPGDWDYIDRYQAPDGEEEYSWWDLLSPEADRLRGREWIDGEREELWR